MLSGALSRVAVSLARRRLPNPSFDPRRPTRAQLEHRAVILACETGIFDALQAGPLDASALAARTGLHARAADLLLRALAAEGHLDLRGDRYALTAASARWLTSASADSLRDVLLFQSVELRLLEHLDHWLRTGQSADRHQRMGPADWVRYQRAMRRFAIEAAPLLVARCPAPPNPTDMLDIGGGHGHLAAEFCRRYPQLFAVVLDLPAAVEAAAPLLASEGLGYRLRHRAADATSAELGKGAVDLVLIGNLVHHLSPEQTCDLLRRVSRALRPGGVVAIYSSVGDAGDRRDPVQDLLGAVLSGGTAWPDDQLVAWLRDAGLEVLPTVPLGPVRRLLPAQRPPA